ncbi:hypothetical protein [Winogradskya humida]|uniref:DUF3558 domain-containing protein n=1 Tax=Winogradskya humida TaxID=113566 RepID=A0ABQ3ZRP7_9ACTN|nr:hypothetical protein [Actinoplanes humidus]GIE21251.1 hypothetical protein Ahu01nite_043530 [Actinoplanes humidus]
MPSHPVPRRSTGVLIATLAAPLVVIVLATATLLTLHAIHQDARWTTVPKTCPTLDAATATALSMTTTPLPDDNARGAFDNTKHRSCYYHQGGDTNNGLQVTVGLSTGGITHGSHAEAVTAMRDNPLPDLQEIGPQNEESQHFGIRNSSHLDLITIVDNAQIWIQYSSLDKIRDVTPEQAEALRPTLQSITDQAVANLG